jgi:hypothetical protein
MKIIADDPNQQHLADYIEQITEPYIRLVQQATFDSLVDGKVRAIKTEIIDDEIVHSVIFVEGE